MKVRNATELVTIAPIPDAKHRVVKSSSSKNRAVGTVEPTNVRLIAG